ncbi:DeSI-like protein [Acorus gramineus]|uniref:DeSI-like protein n=1 Tax=Acorus gramineus TaxID=55184 RepID=A0AAV9AQ01_ACOGR|nr:DeSI-like protein [Acorus gramineus]
MMGSWFSKTASLDGPSDAGTPVILNVYDLTPLNDYMYWLGFGIFHSGIEVYGQEYGFGAHDFPSSGVFEVEPKTCPGFIYRRSISLGHIDMPPSEFHTFLENMASKYHGDTYHLLSKNCNHFTDEVSLNLTGRHIPGWVNRLAWLGTICSCLLPESFQQPVIKELPEYPFFSDGSESPSIATGTEPIDSDDVDQDRHLLSPSSGGDVSFIKEVQR